MTIIIKFYIITCIALLLFDLVFLLVKNRRTHLLYPRDTKFEQQIHQEIRTYEESGAFSQEFQNQLPKKLEKLRNLITLVSVIGEDGNLKSMFSRQIFSMVDVYGKRSQSERAYYAYVVSLMDYEDTAKEPHFISKFMEFLDSNSIYTFSNAMNALYHFGQSNLLLQALEKADERGEFYHKKLLIDGLLGGNVNFQEFNPLVEQHFSSYTPYLQSALLDYFRMNHYDAKVLCMNLIIDENTDEEVRYSAMRYFVKYPCAESQEYFQKVLEDPDSLWITQMLAIQGLSSTDNPAVRHLIGSRITSRDWYVRVNAAKYLYSHNLTHQEVSEILSQRDQYADEILLYCCREDPELSQFITATIAQLEAEDKEKEHSDLVGKEAMA